MVSDGERVSIARNPVIVEGVNMHEVKILVTEEQAQTFSGLSEETHKQIGGAVGQVLDSLKEGSASVKLVVIEVSR